MTEDCTFENGKCKYCDGKCEHEETEITYVRVSATDGGTHKKICSCGAEVPFDGITDSNNCSDWYHNGVCKLCESACTHDNKWTDNDGKERCSWCNQEV